jgi:hypothetical protein
VRQASVKIAIPRDPIKNCPSSFGRRRRRRKRLERASIMEVTISHYVGSLSEHKRRRWLSLFQCNIEIISILCARSLPGISIANNVLCSSVENPQSPPPSTRGRGARVGSVRPRGARVRQPSERGGSAAAAARKEPAVNVKVIYLR